MHTSAPHDPAEGITIAIDGPAGSGKSTVSRLVAEALDGRSVGEVLDTLRMLASEGMTMICVTHEMGFARQVADRVIFMDRGAIVETAPPETFFTAPVHARTRDFLGKILAH